MTVFQDSLQTLKIAQGKFMESGECVEKMTPECKGKSILVPLTGSMYIPGEISDTEHVLIDIGTGYYAQKVSCSILSRTLYQDDTFSNIFFLFASMLLHTLTAM